MMPWLDSSWPLTRSFILVEPLTVPLFATLAVTVTGVPGATFDADSDALCTVTLGITTGAGAGGGETLDPPEGGCRLMKDGALKT